MAAKLFVLLTVLQLGAAVDPLQINILQHVDGGGGRGDFVDAPYQVDGSGAIVPYQDCGLPGEPDHGFTTPNNPINPIGTIVEFYCDPGYILVGYEYNLCLPGGTWQYSLQSLPKCEHPFEVIWDTYGVGVGATSEHGGSHGAYAAIGAITHLAGGYGWHSGPFYGRPQIIWFKFNQGLNIKKYSFTATVINYLPREYIFYGSNAADCTDESAWTNLVQKTSDSQVVDPTVDMVESNAKFTCYGFKITKTGHTDYASLKNLRFYALDANKEYTEATYCLGCNGAQRRPVGYICNYICPPDTTREGAPYGICLSTGTWSNPLPQCKSCSGCNGAPQRPVGYVCNYICPPDTTRQGAPYGICLSTGTWSRPLPQCISCGSPGEPEDGSTKPNNPINPIGTIVGYACDTGFTLVGEDLNKCEPNGMWLNAVPKCK